MQDPSFFTQYHFTTLDRNLTYALCGASIISIQYSCFNLFFLFFYFFIF